MIGGPAISILSDIEQDGLYQALTELVALQNGPRALLAMLMPEELRANLQEGPPVVLCWNAIQICVAGGYHEGKHALFRIVEFVVDSGKPDFLYLKDRLSVQPIDAGGPLEARLLRNRRPFADRAELRRLVDEMSQPTSPRSILAIAGESGSGKSYTAEFLDHYCRTQPDTLFCPLTMSRGYDAEGMAKDLVSLMGGALTPFPPQHANDEAWFDELARWVSDRANAPVAGKFMRNWVLIDGSEHPDLHPHAIKFLTRLQEKFTFGATARMHRLIYCGYPQTLLSALGQKAHRYSTEAVERHHIEEVVRVILAEQPNFPVAERDHILSQTLDFVLEGQTMPLTNLRDVGARLQTVINEAGL